MPDRPDPLTDPVARTLARFTPTAAGLDRDELLFAAGRASAGRTRGWKLAAGLLAVTQAVTLAALLRRDGSPPAQTATPPPVAAPEPPPAEEPSYGTDPASYLVLSRGWDGETLPDSPAAPGSDRPAKPLTAGWRGGSLD